MTRPDGFTLAVLVLVVVVAFCVGGTLGVLA